MTVSGEYVFVANTNSDTVSVIDTKTDDLVQTINVEPYPNVPRGSTPNAVGMINDHQLAVSLGRNNALAVYDWQGPTTALGLPDSYLPLGSRLTLLRIPIIVS